MNRIFIIDDEVENCESIQMILEYEGYHADYSTSPIRGIDEVLDGNYAALCLDIQMPDMNGFEVIKKLKEKGLDTSIIIISAYGNIENAIKATKLGAFDFIEKPIDRDKLLLSIRNAVEQYNLIKENKEIKEIVLEKDDILGKSKAIQDVLSLIDKVAPIDARVLILGENGTGKELVAKAIHKRSNRNDKPFIEVNCAAIPNELIESELFGHEKGSFTGAHQQRIGRFELANGGTLFLDEIGDMSMQAQAKVLKAIEECKIERVGGTKQIEVNVRIIAATNKKLKDEIAKGTFREDLYHRLSVFPITVPPLSDRVEDIPILVKHFANDIANKYKKANVEFKDDALRFLQSIKYTGNIRELRNNVERILILVDKKEISKSDIEILFFGEAKNEDIQIETTNSFQEFKEKTERSFILKQLNENDWNISKTAEIIGIQRSHLYSKMKKYGLIREDQQNG